MVKPQPFHGRITGSSPPDAPGLKRGKRRSPDLLAVDLKWHIGTDDSRVAENSSRCLTFNKFCPLTLV